MSEEVKIFGNTRYAFRRDTLENWKSVNPILLGGEISVVTDGTETEKVKIGDGKTPWNDLPWWKGPQGDQGPQGIQGPKGDKGDKGPQGDDYNLTDADKREIAGMIDVENVDISNAASAIKNTVSGKSFSLYDVSPIPHKCSCRLVSDTINDITTIQLIVSDGENEIRRTPNADGTITDIPSSSPIMNIGTTDDENVNIVDFTYCVDTKEYIEERLKSKVLLDVTLTEEQEGASNVMLAIPDINAWYYAKQINFYVEMPFNAKAVSGETFSICVEDKDHSRYGCYYGYAYSVSCEQGQTLRFNSIVNQYSFENKQTPARQYVAFFAKPFMYEGPNSLGTADKMHGNYNTLSLYNSVPPYLSLKFANGTTFEVGTRIFMEVYY